MVGENTGITCDQMKSGELAEIVGFNGNIESVKSAFGSILFHDGEHVKVVKNNNSYFFSSHYDYKDWCLFYNPNYYLKIIYSPSKPLPKKLTLEDVLSLKEGDVFYYNYGGQIKRSVKRRFIRLTTSFHGYEPNNDPQKLIIKFNDQDNNIDFTHLTDCGVIKYSYQNHITDENGFNKYNCLTFEPIY